MNCPPYSSVSEEDEEQLDKDVRNGDLFVVPFFLKSGMQKIFVMDVAYDRDSRKFVERFYSKEYIVEQFGEEIGDPTQSEIAVKEEQQEYLGIAETHRKILAQEEYDRLEALKPKKKTPLIKGTPAQDAAKKKKPAEVKKKKK